MMRHGKKQRPQKNRNKKPKKSPAANFERHHLPNEDEVSDNAVEGISFLLRGRSGPIPEEERAHMNAFMRSAPFPILKLLGDLSDFLFKNKPWEYQPKDLQKFASTFRRRQCQDDFGILMSISASNCLSSLQLSGNSWPFGHQSPLSEIPSSMLQDMRSLSATLPYLLYYLTLPDLPQNVDSRCQSLVKDAVRRYCRSNPRCSSLTSLIMKSFALKSPSFLKPQKPLIQLDQMLNTSAEEVSDNNIIQALLLGLGGRIKGRDKKFDPKGWESRLPNFALNVLGLGDKEAQKLRIVTERLKAFNFAGRNVESIYLKLSQADLSALGFEDRLKAEIVLIKCLVTLAKAESDAETFAKTYRIQLMKRFSDIFALVTRGTPSETRGLTQKILIHLIDFYALSALQATTYKVNSELSLALHRKNPTHYPISCISFLGFLLKGNSAPTDWRPSKEVVNKFSPDFFLEIFLFTSTQNVCHKEFVEYLWNPLSVEQKRLAIVAVYKKIFSEFSYPNKERVRFFSSLCLSDQSPLMFDLTSRVQPEPILVSAAILALSYHNSTFPELSSSQLKIALTDTFESLELLNDFSILKKFHKEILSQLFKQSGDTWERLKVYAENIDDDLFKTDEVLFTKCLAEFLNDKNLNNANIQAREFFDLLKRKHISKDLRKIIEPNKTSGKQQHKPVKSSLEGFWNDIERLSNGK